MEQETETIDPLRREQMSYKDQERRSRVIGSSLNAKLNAMGHLMHIRKAETLITRTEGSLSEGGLSRIYLRKYGKDEQAELLQLTGPGGICRKYSYSEDTVIWSGETEDLSIKVGLRINEGDTLDWTVSTELLGTGTFEMDCVFGMDLGLADIAALQSNESYVCHYVDQNVEEKPPFGPVLMYRQNLAQSGGHHPWFMLYSPTGAVAYSTDAHDAFGSSHRISGRPQFADGSPLSSSKLQYEYNYPTLQSKTEPLSKGKPIEFQFRAHFKENHPEVSSESDLSLIQPEIPEPVELPDEKEPSDILESFMGKALIYPAEQPARTDLEAIYPNDWVHAEESHGQVLSFFTSEHRHIVTRDKEGLVDRPHGTILIGANDFSWNTGTTATTAYMGGLFNAQLVSGNTSLHKLLSVPRESIGLNRTAGQRIFFRTGNTWYQLGTPTIFEMGRDHVIWYYKSSCLPAIKVSVSIAHNNRDIQLELTSDSVLDEVVITNELVMGNNESELDASVAWDPSTGICEITTGMDTSSSAPGFRISVSPHGEPPLVMEKFPEELGISNLLDLSFSSTSELSLKISSTGLSSPENKTFWKSLTNDLQLRHNDNSVSRMDQALAWYAHNGIIHYLSPHGLEQYSGAAWGTRDVCQGPLELLLANGHHDAARDTLIRTYSAQYMETGDWPQWFMLEEYGYIAQDHSHGDIILWPLKALAMYLSRTGDYSILEAQVDYRLRFPVNQPANAPSSMREHMMKAIEHLKKQFVPGTHLISYGDGDWDDSLQPAQADLRKRLVSSWTVGLCAQTATELANALRSTNETSLVTYLDNLRKNIDTDFHRYLVVNGTLCGFLLFDENLQHPQPLIHPDDKTTGIDLRLIPINRAIISGLFTKAEADRHLQLIDERLKYPDGVRLMTKPAPYSGGKENFFRRAESAANFGREIGLQYVHAHIRYAEALALMGKSDELWDAVQVINPVGITDSVPNALPRQNNMYFSSSDGDFRSRNEAADGMDALKEGKVGAKGGWRLYSSGPGIYTALIIERVLGLRNCSTYWEIDPVLPESLDELTVDWRMEGSDVSIFYDISQKTNQQVSITVNGTRIESSPLTNDYRNPGIRVESHSIINCLKDGSNQITIHC